MINAAVPELAVQDKLIAEFPEVTADKPVGAFVGVIVVDSMELLVVPPLVVARTT